MITFFLLFCGRGSQVLLFLISIITLFFFSRLDLAQRRFGAFAQKLYQKTMQIMQVWQDKLRRGGTDECNSRQGAVGRGDTYRAVRRLRGG